MKTNTVKEGDVLWSPSTEQRTATGLHQYQQWLKKQHGVKFSNYEELWLWSVEQCETFWASVWEFCQVKCSAQYTTVLANDKMPGAEWFPGARLNYAEQIMRHEKQDAPALLYLSETMPLTEMSWREFSSKVRIVATRLREFGVKPGDRVAAYMPNIPETAITMYATTSIGAIWTSCSQDFGTTSVLDRFKQIEPTILLCADGYQYGGKAFNKKNDIREIIKELKTLDSVIYLPYLDPTDTLLPSSNSILWSDLLDYPEVTSDDFSFEQLPFDHPLWILFSSGTTGLPKPLVHSHGGIILEHLKLLALQQDRRPGDRMFFYTTTGWMMWNYLIGSMINGVIPVLYDGNPSYPEPDFLWKLVEDTQATSFGASPTFVQIMQNSAIIPKNKFDLSSLRCISLAGSPVSPECMNWIYQNVKDDVWLASGSGGTDVCTGFVEGVPTLPVKAGLIQGRALGVAAYSFGDDGEPAYGEVGELVITKPMPSMPVYFWNDKNNERYLQSYFEEFPGIWRHGDYINIHDDGSCLLVGRSDATLNRYGIRIGTSEIYRTVEAIPEVEDSLIINLALPDGQFFMPLFVVLNEGLTLNDDLIKRIKEKLRTEYTPRHVPDAILQAEQIPYTISRKKMEVPVRKILLGEPASKAATTGAMANPDSLNFFVNYAKNQNSYTLN